MAFTGIGRVRGRDLRILGLWVAAVLFTGSVGYMLLAGLGPLDALYMTVITVSTVGYREVVPLPPAARAFTILLIAAGVSTFFFAGGVLARTLLANLPARLEKRMQSIIDGMKDHVILCGHGRLGKVVRGELEATGRPFLILDEDEGIVEQLRTEGLPALAGDATTEEILERAGIRRAAGVIAAVGTDAGNLFITLTARQLNPDCVIVARAEDPNSERKLLRVGANQVVPSYRIGGRRLAQAFLRPGAVDLADLALGGGRHPVVIEELSLPSQLRPGQESLVGLGLGQRFRLIAVAVRSPGGELRFNPRADAPLHPGDQLLVMGEREAVDAFQAYLAE